MIVIVDQNIVVNFNNVVASFAENGESTRLVLKDGTQVVVPVDATKLALAVLHNAKFWEQR